MIKFVGLFCTCPHRVILFFLDWTHCRARSQVFFILLWTLHQLTGAISVPFYTLQEQWQYCAAPLLHNLSQWRVRPSEKPGEHNVPSSELRKNSILLSSQGLIWCCSCCPLVVPSPRGLWWSWVSCLPTHRRLKQGEHAWWLQRALAKTLVFLSILNTLNTIIVLFLTSEMSHSNYSFLVLFPHSWTKCCMEMKPCYLLRWQLHWAGCIHSSVFRAASAAW